ncbi:hypothetical protein HK101_000961 [Irineochytrium annulatum]|nr:hypothetical protein HK101_000961 [Irineochytrium annulatum]
MIAALLLLGALPAAVLSQTSTAITAAFQNLPECVLKCAAGVGTTADNVCEHGMANLQSKVGSCPYDNCDMDSYGRYVNPGLRDLDSACRAGQEVNLSTNDSASSSTTSPVLIIVIVLLALVALAAGVYALYLRRRSRRSDSNNFSGFTKPPATGGVMMYNKPTDFYAPYNNTGVAGQGEQPLPELTYPEFNPPTGVFTAPPEKASPLFDPIARDGARIEKGQSPLFDPITKDAALATPSPAASLDARRSGVPTTGGAFDSNASMLKAGYGAAASQRQLASTMLPMYTSMVAQPAAGGSSAALPTYGSAMQAQQQQQAYFHADGSS